MIIGARRTASILFFGDFIAFSLSLYLSLWLRYLTLPTFHTLSPYLVPFPLLFGLWILIFYSSGLYSKQASLFPSRLPDRLFRTQLANILVAALFFFLIPQFGITPKTILFLYLLFSLALVFLWRLVLYPKTSIRRAREKAILLVNGRESDELFAEINGNDRYSIEFSGRELTNAQGSILVIDTHNESPALFREFDIGKYQIISFEDLYEEVFDRIPLSQLNRAWFRENVAPIDSFWYVLPKRLIDLIGGFVMGIVTIILVPFIWFANLLENSGPLFIIQERLGLNTKHIRVYKFRSMSKNLSASREWVKEGENQVTKVGAFLRKTSLDEFPQFINVLKGQLSLIGPRNDILGLGERLGEALPYYYARYQVKPGITGWAQINQQYEPGNTSPQSIEETKVRLAYDFYYLKHRSFALDMIIALKTVKRMFFRVSSW